MGWQIPDIFQSINNIGREMFVMLTGHELKKTGACRGSVSCWCLVLWSLPLAVCHGDLGKHSAKIICVHQEPHDRSEGQIQQTSNFKIPRLSKKKQNTTSLLTLQHQKCPRPSNLCKTLFLKVPSEPFKARPNIKKMKTIKHQRQTITEYTRMILLIMSRSIQFNQIYTIHKS